MDLKSLLPKHSSGEPKENFWTIVIEPGWVQVGIWYIINNTAKVTAVSLPCAWKENSELVKAADSAMSSAIQLLPDDETEPKKCVFAVLSSWVESDEIKQEHLAKIQTICKELDIEPAGFVVLPEAISNYFKTQEGSPLSAVVVGITDTNLEVSIFKLGTLIGTKFVSRSLSIVEDLTEGVTRFESKDSLPSRIILYDGKEGELEEERQAFMKANWEDYENVNFLHTPKIEIVDTKEKVYAVILAGAVDIGNASKIAVEVNEFSPEDIGSEIGDEHANVDAASAASLGFAVGKDVIGSENDLDKDFSMSHQELIDEVRSGMELNAASSTELNPSLQTSSSNYNHNVGNEMALDSKKGLFSKIKSKIPRFKKPNFKPKSDSSKILNLSSKPLVIGVIIFILLLLIGFAAWWFIPKSEVTVYLSTSSLDEKISLTADSSTDEFDVGNATLPGDLIEQNVSGNKTKSTTGTKTVGDKATGKITIYRVGSESSLDSGDIVTGPNSLKFTLDESVSIASGSASSPGKTTVGVTASDIGEDYNLAANSSFTIANFSASDMEGINETEFSGGSSREIQSVSEDDQTELKEALLSELKDKALQQLKESLSQSCSECMLIEESYTYEVIDESFDHKIDDESDTVSLETEIKASAVAIKKSDLNFLAKEVLKERIPEGYVLRDEQIEVSFEFEEQSDDEFIMTASISANLFPEVDPEEIADRIAGKYPQIAENYFKENVPGYQGAEIIMTPALPGRLGTLPHDPSNIEVMISSGR